MARKPLDTEEATEAEVLALMEAEEPAESENEDDIDDESIDDDSEEAEEGSEEEETEETEDAEDTEEEPEEEDAESEEDGDDSEVNWEEVDPKARKAFEKAQAEAQKWKSDHGKLQSQWTKASQSQKDQERVHEELRKDSENLHKWNDFFEAHPEAAEAVKKAIAKAKDPFSDNEAAEYLKEDPAFQYLQKTITPYIKNLESKVRDLQSKNGAVDSQRKETENRKYLDGQLEKAGARIESMLGRKATQDDIRQVLQYMVNKKYYDDGELAAEVVFRSQYQKALSQKRGTSLKEKAKRFPSRNKSVNPARTQGRKEANTPEEAIAMALAEQGIT